MARYDQGVLQPHYRSTVSLLVDARGVAYAKLSISFVDWDRATPDKDGPALMTGNADIGLTLWLVDCERQPEHPIDCLEFAAVASIRNFRGRARFSIYKRDLDTFLDELDAMVTNLAGRASVRAGWDENVLFEMKVGFFSGLGHIAVGLELADRGPREHMQRLIVEMRTEPALLQSFAECLRRVAETVDETPVRLEGVDA